MENYVIYAHITMHYTVVRAKNEKEAMNKINLNFVVSAENEEEAEELALQELDVFNPIVSNIEIKEVLELPF